MIFDYRSIGHWHGNSDETLTSDVAEFLVIPATDAVYSGFITRSINFLLVVLEYSKLLQYSALNIYCYSEYFFPTPSILFLGYQDINFRLSFSRE